MLKNTKKANPTYCSNLIRQRLHIEEMMGPDRIVLPPIRLGQKTEESETRGRDRPSRKISDAQTSIWKKEGIRKSVEKQQPISRQPEERSQNRNENRNVQLAPLKHTLDSSKYYQLLVSPKFNSADSSLVKKQKLGYANERDIQQGLSEVRQPINPNIGKYLKNMHEFTF